MLILQNTSEFCKYDGEQIFLQVAVIAILVNYLKECYSCDP